MTTRYADVRGGTRCGFALALAVAFLTLGRFSAGVAARKGPKFSNGESRSHRTA